MNSKVKGLLPLILLVFALYGLAGTAEFVENEGFDYQPPEPGTYNLPVVKPAVDGEIVDADGKSLRLADLTRGKITILSFIYTRCAAPKGCPFAMGVLNQIHRSSQEESALAQKMRLVSMSFDPGMDSPERMASYSAWIQGRTNSAEWKFVTTLSSAALQPILEGYGQAVDRKENRFDPTGPLSHTLRVFLIDREGRIRNIYSAGTLDPRLVLADVRTLILESSSPVGRR